MKATTNGLRQGLRKLASVARRQFQLSPLPRAEEGSTQVDVDSLRDYAERVSQVMLGTSFDKALSRLETGDLAGTRAESELRMLQQLMSNPRSCRDREPSRMSARPSLAHADR